MNQSTRSGAAMGILLCAAALITAGAAQARATEEHEAELMGGESLHLGNLHSKPMTYRICIAPLPGDVKVKVRHDGEVTEVQDGSCETIRGKNVKVMADSKLPAGEYLQLKFRQEKG